MPNNLFVKQANFHCSGNNCKNSVSAFPNRNIGHVTLKLELFGLKGTIIHHNSTNIRQIQTEVYYKG